MCIQMPCYRTSFLSILCEGIKPTYLLHGLYNFHKASHILAGLWPKAHFLGLLVPTSAWGLWPKAHSLALLVPTSSWIFGPWSFHSVIKPGLIRIGPVLSSSLLGLHSSKDVASGFMHHTFMVRAHTNIWTFGLSNTHIPIWSFVPNTIGRWQCNLFIW